MPRKAVDLGYLFPYIVFYNLHSTEKARMKKNREADDIYDTQQFVVIFKGKSCTLIHRLLGLSGLIYM